MRLIVEHEGRQYQVADKIENLRIGPFEEPITSATAMVIGAMFGMLEQLKKGEPASDLQISIHE